MFFNKQIRSLHIIFFQCHLKLYIMEQNESNSYFEFLGKHRMMLSKKQSVGHLSAGLQTKVTFVRDDKTPSHKSDLITITSPRYCMGGAYLWKYQGTWKHPITGSEIPLYGNQTPVKTPNYNILCPVQGHPNLKLTALEGFLTIGRFDGKNKLEIDEILEEKLGEALFFHNISKYNFAKIELRDLTGNGFLDVVFGTNDWSDYFPSTEINGKEVRTRWGHESYRPFDGEGEWRGGPLHGEVFLLENNSSTTVEDLKPENIEQTKISFSAPQKIENVDQYGDFTGDGLQDMIAGDFLQSLTFFKRKKNDEVSYAEGTPLLNQQEKPIQLE